MPHVQDYNSMWHQSLKGKLLFPHSQKSEVADEMKHPHAFSSHLTPSQLRASLFL